MSFIAKGTTPNVLGFHDPATGRTGSLNDTFVNLGVNPTPNEAMAILVQARIMFDSPDLHNLDILAIDAVSLASAAITNGNVASHRIMSMRTKDAPDYNELMTSETVEILGDLTADDKEWEIAETRH